MDLNGYSIRAQKWVCQESSAWRFAAGVSVSSCTQTNFGKKLAKRLNASNSRKSILRKNLRNKVLQKQKNTCFLIREIWEFSSSTVLVINAGSTSTRGTFFSHESSRTGNEAIQHICNWSEPWMFCATAWVQNWQILRLLHFGSLFKVIRIVDK